MKTMAYYFLKWHSRAQVLQAQLFQPLPKTQGTKGQAARQRDLSVHCSLWALSSEQDTGRGYSGTERQGLFLLIPVNDSHTDENLSHSSTGPDREKQSERRRRGQPAPPQSIPSKPPNGDTVVAALHCQPEGPWYNGLGITCSPTLMNITQTRLRQAGA